MFVVPTIQHEYIGDVVVDAGGGMRTVKSVNITNINVPINLRNACYFRKGEIVSNGITLYQVLFQFQRFDKVWNYYKEADRDNDYEKLMTLNSIGVMCKLEDIE